MRISGTLDCFKQPCAASGFGDLPENWQNTLYAYGTPNSNYQDGVNGSSTVVSGTIAFMQNLAAKGYPVLPYANSLDQTPGVIPSGIPSVYFPPKPVSVQNTAPPPIFIATVPAQPSPPPPAPVYVPPPPPPAPVYVPRPPSPVGSSGPRGSLQGIPDSERSAFPMPIRGPSVSGNNFWYTGQPTLNRGVPVWSNDANEFLRHAMVESDWDDVEIWLAWAIANGFDQNQLYLIDFGRYKYTQNETSQRIYYPFSSQDYETFFNRFLKYATAVPADQDCIRKKLELYRRAIKSNPRNQFSLRLSECPLTTGWGLGLLKAVAVIAVPYAIASAATAIAAAGASGAAGAGTTATLASTGSATGVSAATGAGSVAATATAAAAPVIETVVVAASAIPVFGTTAAVSAAVSAGAIVALATPPPISAPAISASPQPVETPIETVTVQASALAPAPVLPTVTLATSLPLLETALPLPEFIEPQVPEIEDSVYDNIKTELKELAGSIGAEKLKEVLAEKLQDKLQREPTVDEEIAFEEYVDALPPGPVLQAQSQSNAKLILLGFGVAAVILFTRKKRK